MPLCMVSGSLACSKEAQIAQTAPDTLFLSASIKSVYACPSCRANEHPARMYACLMTQLSWDVGSLSTTPAVARKAALTPATLPTYSTADYAH